MKGRRSERRWIAAGACASALFGVVGGAIALGAAEPTGDIQVILGEMRSAVGHTSEIRAQADRGGDPIKARCAYDSLRGILAATSSAEVAQVAWESARARGDEAAAQVEVQKAQTALDLVRRLRNEADNCVGRELARGEVAASGATTVTVESNVRDDDPNAGPAEAWTLRPTRLELPASALPASPFRVPGG